MKFIKIFAFLKQINPTVLVFISSVLYWIYLLFNSQMLIAINQYYSGHFIMADRELYSCVVTIFPRYAFPIAPLYLTGIAYTAQKLIMRS